MTDYQALIRYGLQWNGPSDFVCVPMADGYWTPWHHAKALLEERGAQLERESKALTLAVEDVRQFRDRARAAEQERDSLRADAEKFRALKAKVGHLYDFDAMGSTAPFTGTGGGS